MTNKEIMQANLLDIIFENRNKEYGAYALRKGYNNRLLAAMGAGMSVILLLVFMNAMKPENSSLPASPKPKEEMVIRQIEMPKDKPKEPEQPKEVVKQQKAAVPKVAQVKFTTPPRIEKIVKDPLPTIEDLTGKVTSTVTVAGPPDDGIVKEQPKTVETGVTEAGPAAPKEPEFMIQERDPEFPGGQAALQKFLARYLATPGQLESGEKKVVRIRFKVDKDGSVNTFEVVASGGDSYDNEVVRVCRKMPKWIPAIQNGVNVPVSYVLPVTFIGVEE